MTRQKSRSFTVIDNRELKERETKSVEYTENKDYHSNPIYEKLLNFRNLQEAQKKKFSVDDLFKLC